MFACFAALGGLSWNLDHRRDRWASLLPASFLSPVCVCLCSCTCLCAFCSLTSAPFALPCHCLFVDFLSNSSSLPPSLPSFLPFCALPVVRCAPSSLLPPCSLIPPSPSLFGCHLVSYVSGMGGEWLWCLGAIRLTSRHSLAFPRVLWWH